MTLTPEEQAAADQEAERLKVEEAEALAEQQFAEGFGEEIVAEKVELTEEQKASALALAKEAEDKELAGKEAEETAKTVVTTEPKPDEKLAHSVSEVKQALDSFSGSSAAKIASLEQSLVALQNATPLGKKVEITEADFAELTADIPDMTPKIVSGLKRVFEKLVGTAPVQETPEQFEARVNAVADKRIDQRLEERKRQDALDTLTKLHPNWRTEIGPAGSDTEYRQWLATQPYNFATEALTTWDPHKVSEVLTKFHDFKKGQTAPVPKVTEVTPEPKKPASSTRVQRLAEAVTPKGGAPAPVKKIKTAEEEFAEGYNS